LVSEIVYAERLVRSQDSVDRDWSQRWVEGGIVICLGGELDMSTAAELELRLLAVARSRSGGGLIRLDLSGVTFIDALSIGIIVRAWTAARSRGRPLRVHGLHGVAAELFDLFGLRPLLVSAAASELHEAR
jgi:anti-anti-sigma factor